MNLTSKDIAGLNLGAKPRPSPIQLDAAYRELGSVHRVGARFGVCGETIRAWMKKASVKIERSDWSAADIETLRSYYRNTPAERFSLNEIARKLGRKYMGVANQAKRLGLGDYCRKKAVKPKATQTELPWSKWVKFPHPKGMAGKKHTDEVKSAIAKNSSERWEKDKATGTGLMTDTARQRRSDLMLQRNLDRIRGGGVNQGYSRAKRGYRDDLGKNYFRSRWEANFARYLNFLIGMKEIKKWEFESETFWFEAIRRGVRSYTPDFKVWRPDDSIYFIEVKGWMDPKSATKLKRMRIYHPSVEIELVDQKRYEGIKRTCAPLIPNWE